MGVSGKDKAYRAIADPAVSGDRGGPPTNRVSRGSGFVAGWVCARSERGRKAVAPFENAGLLGRQPVEHEHKVEIARGARDGVAALQAGDRIVATACGTTVREQRSKSRRKHENPFRESR